MVAYLGSCQELPKKRITNKTQISDDNGHKRPAPVTDSAISNTSEEDDEELGEDLGDLDDLLAPVKVVDKYQIKV